MPNKNRELEISFAPDPKNLTISEEPRLVKLPLQGDQPDDEVDVQLDIDWPHERTVS